ncbi:MAG: bifunctional folylpolyglutamate synthase/dihydrofolate synthase [Candidatus Eisenbacteria bacterium]|nr:bifunctional folylpolyglutamate synthase/dihydrofolate synthase [Candidatus Eisenbacteria bacterium]
MDRQEGRAFSSYRACLDWLFARHRFVMKPGLERVERLLSSVGSPHRKFRIVHVGGTNGKGSTACLIASILTEHGLRTGLYMSPHVTSFVERMSIDGRAIAPERVLDIVERLKPAADEIEATFFEITTAAAAVYFAEEGVDIVVAEVGLGGRLDATNALESALSVITRVAIDHADILGSDVAAIAAEKAGIIRQSGSVVCGAEGDALDVVRGVAAARKARFIDVRDASKLSGIQVSTNGSSFDFTYGDRSYEELSISMLGGFQLENARVALVAAHELDRLGIVTLNEPALRRGLLEGSCLGRMQIIDRRPTIVADVAHNPDGAHALMVSVGEVVKYERMIVVLGIMGDKDIKGFVAALVDYVDLVIATAPSADRAADAEELAEAAREVGIEARAVPSPGAAIEQAISEAREGDLVLVTGSHYTVGDVMTSLGVGQTLGA